MTKFVKTMITSVVSVCAGLTMVVCGIGIINADGQPSMANTLSNISTTDLPEPTSIYEYTTQAVEEFTLNSGSIYFLEAWGAKGGNGDTFVGGNTNGGFGGKGSYAAGWCDMRSGATTTATIFAGGVGGTNGAGWGATVVAIQLQGTRGGSVTSSNGGGGGGASGIYVGTTAVLIAGGGGGGGGGGNVSGSHGGSGGGQNGDNGLGTNGSYGGTQSEHGVGGGGTASVGQPGTDNGGGSSNGCGGGAGGGWTRGFAGAGGGSSYDSYQFVRYRYSGGGGSGGTSYIGGVQSLSDSEAGTEWAVNDGNGKVRITEYIMGYGAGTPTSTDDYTVSAPSESLVLPGESYAFTITRTIGTGHIGLNLNTTNGTLSLTSINGNVFTYTVSNIQGQITANDFSVTTYNVNAPSDGEGYTISPPSSTNILIGGLYTFTITLEHGFSSPIVKLTTLNGKLGLSSTYENTYTYTISNVAGNITADNFTVSVSRTQ